MSNKDEKILPGDKNKISSSDSDSESSSSSLTSSTSTDSSEGETGEVKSQNNALEEPDIKKRKVDEESDPNRKRNSRYEIRRREEERRNRQRSRSYSNSRSRSHSESSNNDDDNDTKSAASENSKKGNLEVEERNLEPENNDAKEDVPIADVPTNILSTIRRSKSKDRLDITSPEEITKISSIAETVNVEKSPELPPIISITLSETLPKIENTTKIDITKKVNDEEIPTHQSELGESKTLSKDRERRSKSNDLSTRSKNISRSRSKEGSNRRSRSIDDRKKRSLSIDRKDVSHKRRSRSKDRDNQTKNRNHRSRSRDRNEYLNHRRRSRSKDRYDNTLKRKRLNSSDRQSDRPTTRRSKSPQDRNYRRSLSKERAKEKDVTSSVTKTDQDGNPVIPERQRKTVDLLTSKTGGAYIPPAKLRMMQAEITDKASVAYQRISWEALKKSIHGFINKVNVDNIGIITRELLRENIIRGRGLLSRSIIQAQAASPTFTHVYAALVAVINSKFPNIGELLLKRLVIQFKRGFRRNDKNICLSSSRFIAHLVNQRVAHEILALEILTLLVETPTDDSVEVAISFLKESGQKLTEVSSKGINAIFEMLKNILHEGKLDKRVQYMIEVVFQVRKDGFKDHPSVIEALELVEEDDQFTHLIMLDDVTDGQDILNVFKFDEEYIKNEEKYKNLSKELLASDASDSNGSSGSDESGDDSNDSDNENDKEEGEKKDNLIIDNTETNLIALRRTIYLTIHSSLDYEECAHKLMKMELKPGQEMELCHMFLDCCAEQRTYEKFYGLLAQRFCMINKIYITPFEEIFRDTYQTTHRLDTNRLRNVSKFFAHLLFTDAISWDTLECIKLNEDDTTSSSRIFIKILFQELAEYMGLGKLNTRLKDVTLQESFQGLFPRDNPKNTRFAINFFTSIGLGGLTDELREHLKAAPKVIPPISKQLDEAKSSESDSSSTSSSDDTSSSSSESSSSSSSDERSKKKSSKKMSMKNNGKHGKPKTNLNKQGLDADDSEYRKDYTKHRRDDRVTLNKNNKLQQNENRNGKEFLEGERRSRITERSTTRNEERQEKSRVSDYENDYDRNGRHSKHDDRHEHVKYDDRRDRRDKHDDRRDKHDDRQNKHDDRRDKHDDQRDKNDDRRDKYDDRRDKYNDRRDKYDDRRDKYNDRDNRERDRNEDEHSQRHKKDRDDYQNNKRSIKKISRGISKERG